MNATSDPCVSVVIPAYNAAAYIAEALASAQAQTLHDIEILVCDDASTDATAAIVAGIALNDPRVRYFLMPVNGGPSVARNLGFAKARGRWIALLDSDDAFVPERLERMVALAEAQQAILCSDNLMLEPIPATSEPHAMIPKSILMEPRPLELPEFIYRNVTDPVHPGLNFGFLKPIIRRDFLIANDLYYDETVRFAEDFALYLACFQAGATWWLMPEAGYRYRVRGDSITQIQTVHDLGVLRARLAALLIESLATNDPTLPSIIRRHKRVVDRCYHYRSFTDSVKSGEIRKASSELLSSPRAALLIAEEVLRQVPTIGAKLIKGGYFRTSS
jgi:glycosyltransferase involved in cell wall biosynthesis